MRGITQVERSVERPVRRSESVQQGGNMCPARDAAQRQSGGNRVSSPAGLLSNRSPRVAILGFGYVSFHGNQPLGVFHKLILLGKLL